MVVPFLYLNAVGFVNVGMDYNYGNLVVDEGSLLLSSFAPTTTATSTSRSLRRNLPQGTVADEEDHYIDISTEVVSKQFPTATASASAASKAAASATTAKKIMDYSTTTVSCYNLIQEYHLFNYTTENYGINHHMNLRYTTSISSSNIAPKFWISLHDKEFDPVRWSIMEYGKYYEQEQTNLFITILQQAAKAKAKNERTGDGASSSALAQRQDPPRVIDVGGNIGWYTLLSAAMGAQVDVFEPNQFNILRMCESICMNSWINDPNGRSCFATPNKNAGEDAGGGDAPRILQHGDDDDDDDTSRVRIHRNGVGATHNEYVSFATNKKNPGASMIVPTTTTTKKNDATNAANANNAPKDQQQPSYIDRVDTIKLVSLDEIAIERGWLLTSPASSGPIIDILKVDVEGHELGVFQGAKKLLQSGLIKNIFMEGNVGSKELKLKFNEIVDIFYDAHYELVRTGGYIGPKNDVKYNMKNITNKFEFQNVVLKECTTNNPKPRSSCNMWWRLRN